MDLTSIYNVVRSERYSELDSSTLKNKLKLEFNLNKKKKIIDYLLKDDKAYQGKVVGDTFTIIKNSTSTSQKDVLYFFYTQISGKVVDDNGKSKVVIEGRISEQILGMIGGSSVVYLLILVFIKELWVLGCFLFVLGILLHARYRVRKDFVIFEKEITQKLRLRDKRV